MLALGPAAAAGSTAAELRLSWASGLESDLGGYRLRYRTEAGLWSEAIDTGLDTTWTVTGLALDTTYSFTVSAYDLADNESPLAPELLARIPSSMAPIPQVLGVVDTASNSIYAARSHAHLMRFVGRNLQHGAVPHFGPDISIAQPTTGSQGEIVALVTVEEDAILGPRVATIVNPDQGIGSASHLIRVVKNPDGNDDCSVDILDLNALARAWNELSSESRYIAESDLDDDHFVGPDDLTIFVKFLGRSPTGCP